jgi:trans-aconitate 2-methyltransferase
LGCGAGPHAGAIAARWPNRPVTAIDSSAHMLAEAAKTNAPVTWLNADIETWRAPEKAALIYSNATLQWLTHHEKVFPRLLSDLAPHGVLAVQMPRNFENPSQRLMRETARNGPWAPTLAPLFEPDSVIPSMLRPDPVSAPDVYYDWLAPMAKGGIELWETEYVHQLTGENAVLEWMRGTTLQPVMGALEGALRDGFVAAYTAALAVEFPRRTDGKTLLKFRRLFLVARV